MILETLNPEYSFSSLVKITPEWMHRHNYRVLLIDIDNTLLPRNSCVVPEKHVNWLQKMQRRGVALVLASNNGGNRVTAIKRQLQEKKLNIPVLTWAGKPFPWAYANAMQLLLEYQAANGIDMAKCESGILAAGDQLFTDVLGAHWYNLPAVWLRPLSQNDFIGTKMLRVLERCVIWYLKKQGAFPEEDKWDI